MLEGFIIVSANDSFKYAGLATVCIVCLKRITEFKLQKCAGCKLVFYCSKEHQKLHWPKHKQLCKAVQLMIKRTDDVGLFDDYIDEGFRMWLYFSRSLIYVCESIVKRRLYREEKGLFLNPFACKLCHIHKHNLMITCKDCCVISYCSEEHQNKDKAKHSLVCEKLRFCLDFDRVCNTTFGIKTFISDIATLPSDMKTFFDKFVDIQTEPHVDDRFVQCYLSNSLTIPLTLIYIVEKSKICIGKETLRIHIVGSGSFEGGAWWCWEYIFHYFKELCKINFVFIGPDSSDQFIPPILLCSHCKNMRSVTFITESSYYSEYVKRNTEAPDVIVAFNCGFHEFKYLAKHDTWKDSMPALCSYPGAILAFTSYQQDESISDLKALKEFSNCDSMNILTECEENPFKSLIPFHDWYGEESGVYFNNNFITILTT